MAKVSGGRARRHFFVRTQHVDFHRFKGVEAFLAKLRARFARFFASFATGVGNDFSHLAAQAGFVCLPSRQRPASRPASPSLERPDASLHGHPPDCHDALIQMAKNLGAMRMKT